MNDIDVSIIIINYKTFNLVKDCIASVKERSSLFTYEIIVVDNSVDEEELKKLKLLESDDVHVIDAKGNLGTSKANNLGASVAKGKYLYFLNSDTLLINNAIYELKKFLDEHNDVGAVGSNLYSKDLKPNHSYIEYEKNIKAEKKMYSATVQLKKRIFKKRADFNYTGKNKRIYGYVCSASMMIRKPLFDDLGGFDEDIFMYAEESLLCYRCINEKHYKIYNIPSSKIIHFEGASSTPASYRHYKTYVDGNVVYYTKLFSKETAIKFLETMKKIMKFRKFISKFIFKNKHQQFVAFYDACDDKLKEIN